MVVVGNGGRDNTEIVINGGLVTSQGVGIYHPQNGKLTVNDGTIVGESAIYFCGGDLEIKGGVIQATGEKRDYISTQDGFDATGDALVVDNRYANNDDPVTYGKVTVKVSGGTFTSKNAEAVASYVSALASEAGNAALKGFIKGGDFSSDPSAYIAKGYARCASKVEGCVYSVAELDNNEVQVAPVAPKVEVSEDIDDGTKTEIEENAGKAAIDGIDDETINEVAGKVTADTDDAKEALRDIMEVTEETPVNIFVQPTLEVAVTEIDTEGDVPVITFDISAVAQVYATTAETSGDMDETNSVAIDTKEIDTDGKEVTITIPVPASIIGAGEVMVKHIKEDDTVYYYETTVNMDNTITFVNPHGFSEFVVSAADENEIEVAYTSNGRPVKGNNGANIPNSEKFDIYDIGVAEIELPTARKTGYSFKGWKIDGVDGTQKEPVMLTQAMWDEAVENDGILKAEAVFVKSKDSVSGLGGAGGEVVTSYTVSFNTNGGSQIESIKVFKGNKVSVPMAPIKDGETFEGWYTDEECTKKYDFSSNVYSSFTLYAKWIGESETIFADVTEADWFYDVVNEAYTKGLMNGMDEENFGPQLDINRAMFVTVLYRIAGKPEAKATVGFTDVQPGVYYEDAVAWAVASAIVEGYGDGIFGSTDPITREQMAAILYRFAQYKGIEIGGAGETFSDTDSIADWAKPAVDWATGAGILNGMGDGTYAPKSTATRAQGAAVFVRIDALVK